MSGKSGKVSIDRLSTLPDRVICHILSFLPTKLSVSTCVLAKRWRFLWAHVPVWDFEGDIIGGEFFKDEALNPDVIYRVIMRHKAKTIHTLLLSRIDCNEYQLETWVTTAIERNVQKLYLDFQGLSIALLHRTLFTCKTMVHMVLHNGKCLPSTGNICLPSLKTLRLSNVEYEDDEALPHLLSGCPLLKELILDCWDDENDMRFFNVSSSTIKMLQVNLQSHWVYSEFWILTIAPAVRCLRLVDCNLDWITITKPVSSLVELDIGFTHSYKCCVDYSDQSNLVKFFNVRCLKISSREYLKVIDSVVGSVIKFTKLTKLELQLGVEWHLLVEFLEVADNLEVLIADVKIHNSCAKPKQVPKCLLSSLKTITIKQPSFEEHELDLVRYLLWNSQVLERMKILHPKETLSGFLKNDLTVAFEALQRIALFERGSMACQLAFFLDG